MVDVVSISTESVAKLLLGHPSIVFTFFVNGVSYDILSIKIIDIQSVLIYSLIPTDSPVIFNLPSYIPDEDIGTVQSAECFHEMIDGLNNFNASGLWGMKQSDFARISIEYKKIS